MRQELDEQLCKDFPKIFRDRHASMKVTCMCWGFDVNDGWYQILHNACALIQWHTDQARTDRARILRKQRKGETLHQWEVENLAKKVPRQVVATQIKEKFGTLRFYYQGGDDYVDGIVQMAEAMTGVTCEDCGAPGKRSRGGWVSVKCDPCRVKQQGFADDVEEDESTIISEGDLNGTE